MTQAELIAIVETEIRDLSSLFTSVDGYTIAVDNAKRDTGFSLPNSVNFQIKWLKERIIRHLLFSLLMDNATKFKFKQLNLQQQFEHFKSLVDMMDTNFVKALQEEYLEFSGASTTQYFGHKIDAGFAYDESGEDITYDEDQIIMVKPSDTD